MAELGRIAAAADGRYEFQITRRYARSIEDVWDALTNPARLANWFCEMTYDPAPGTPVVMDFGDGDVSRGAMVAFEPPHRFEFSSKDSAEGADTVIRFALRTEGDETVLELTQTRQFASTVRRTAPGWHACMELLSAELRGEPLEWGPVWDRVKALYLDATANLD